MSTIPAHKPLHAAQWPSLSRRSVLCLAAAAPWPAHAQPKGVHPRPLAFPRDRGAHPETRTEWWYVTGALHAADQALGFQVTFFRTRTDVPTDHPSRFAARQLVFAHAAVTDLRQGRLRHDQRVARAGFDIAQAGEDDTALTLRDWRLQRDKGRYRAQLASALGGFNIDLTLTPTQPVLLQGDAGYSRKGPAASQASHYYSEPQLAVDGTVTLDGRSLAVHGKAWLDHEWSDSLLDDAAVGWDWIGMNLDDGSALTAFRMRRADGSTLWAGGSFRTATGTPRDFGPDEVHFSAGRTWTSPMSRAAYPVAWRIDTPAGRFTVQALLDGQELDSRASTGAIYWEGLSELRNERGQRIGLGYLEMTGYAAALRL